MSDEKKIRTILKFDTGADGFQKMIYVLSFAAFMVLILGGYFLIFEFKKLLPGNS